jgi:Arc/MetJ-type ribon-helix-helix transcriptional regulator
MLDNLAPEQSQYIVAAIASGKYQSEVEALNQAVWLLQRRDQLEQSLRTASAEFAAGGGIPEDELFNYLEATIDEIERGAKVEPR